MSARQEHARLQAFIRNAPSEAQVDELLDIMGSRLSELLDWRPPGRNALATIRRSDVPPALTPKITTHAVYRWLASAPSFERAKHAFDSRRPATSHATADAVNELLFVDSITTWAAWAISTHGSNWKPPTISSAQRSRANICAEELLGYLRKGIQLSDRQQSGELERLLRLLCVELNLPTKRAYSGPDARERALCTNVGKCLARVAGLPNKVAVEIVEHFAELCGLTISRRSAQRYMAIARGSDAPPLRQTRKKAASRKPAKKR